MAWVEDEETGEWYDTEKEEYIPKKKVKWVSTDAWRGYYKPSKAVAGSSDTGTWSDSPAPTPEVSRELKELEGYLNEAGIDTDEVALRSSNLFMAKRWIIPKDEEKYQKAKKLAKKWLSAHERETRHIHDA